MRISIPELSLVLLVGPSGCGKSTFAKKHFLPTEIVSSDACRAMVCDDETDQSATPAAFELVHAIVARRLAAGKLVVVDATNVQAEARKSLLEIARKHHVLTAAIAFKLPEEVCQARNALRPNRAFGPHVVRNQTRDLHRSLGSLRKETKQLFVLDSVEQVDSATVSRNRIFSNRREDTGPFDIIGDVHGCFRELKNLLGTLGYAPDGSHPEGRRALFLGDLVDRGPDSPGVVLMVKEWVEAGRAIAVPGNHDIKLVRHLQGKKVNISHGLEETLKQLESRSGAEIVAIRDFLQSLTSHFVLDGGRLVVAHAGMQESMQGRASGAVRDFALYGETTGETDEFGLPVRVKWAESYRGKAMVVYGHTPVVEAQWLNNTICIDTGCVFGGSLTALRYPEKELVSVPAERVYCEPVRPLEPSADDRPSEDDGLLDAGDILGRQFVSCPGFGTILIPHENASAALEVMSRYAADPRWLAYLPPTMSPVESSPRAGVLEHTDEALSYFASAGVPQVVAEEKHMGSRAVLVVGRDEDAIARRFGVPRSLGVILSRTGRRFFTGDEARWERGLLERTSTALMASGFWEKLKTDWTILDAELLPWSAKAQALLKRQFAPVAAASQCLRPVEQLLRQAGAEAWADRWKAKAEAAEAYSAAYNQYCWPVSSLEDYKVAPFVILAVEGELTSDRGHAWHMETLAEVCAQDPGVLRATPWRAFQTDSPADAAALAEWWESLTAEGGEGLVVKPMAQEYGAKRLAQPGVKVRGREYLRIIYGPEYLFPENLTRLKSRSVGRKRSLAMKEFALGREGLQRFLRREPLRLVHQCAFGVLALESEAVDPRL